MGTTIRYLYLNKVNNRFHEKKYRSKENVYLLIWEIFYISE